MMVVTVSSTNYKSVRCKAEVSLIHEGLKLLILTALIYTLV
jgi:hypothetical protein